MAFEALEKQRGTREKILTLIMSSILLITEMGVETENRQPYQIHNKLLVTSDMNGNEPGKGAGRAGGVESVHIWTIILVADGARIGSFSSKQAGHYSENPDSLHRGKTQTSPNIWQGMLRA